MATYDAGTSDAFGRQMSARAAMVGLLMRNSVNVGVSLIALAGASPSGRVLLALLAAWSVYRLCTRSRAAGCLTVDYVFVLVTCTSLPALVADPGFHLSNSAPQAIAGTAVVSISVSVAPRVSLVLTLGVAACYAVGTAGVTGWSDVSSVTALYYFAVQWATASVIRIMLLGVATTVDRVRTDRENADLARQVNDAVRDYEHEQVALLHDTAASTLLMVGHGTALDPRRVAAQARRDLTLLREKTWTAPPPWVNLVGALRQCAEHLTTPVEFDGHDRLWLPGRTAQPVIAAAREVMTNVDRHADADRLRITVSDTMVCLRDDGRGFDAHAPLSRHGLRESVLGRMQRSGGHARITSRPQRGTTVELSWLTGQPDDQHGETDALVVPARTRYGLALTAYAVINLLVTVPPAAAATSPGLNTALGILAALGALAGVPAILWGRTYLTWPAATALLAVAVVQPLSVTGGSVLGYAHWAQSGIGWCVLPLLLSVPVRVGAAILVGYWVVGNAVVLWQDPTGAALVNIGLGTASILGVQLFALVFNELMRQAAAAAHSETRAHHDIVARERVATALRVEYQRRYADIVERVVPLLESLTSAQVIDADTRSRARAECRRLRALFEQTGTFAHPLMQAIRPLVDAAEGRDVDVTVDVIGSLPDLDDTHIAAVTAAVSGLLDHAENHARVVVSCSEHVLEVSVVCDRGTATEDHVYDADVVVDDDQLWCLIRRPLGGGQPVDVADSIGR